MVSADGAVCLPSSLPTWTFLHAQNPAISSYASLDDTTKSLDMAAKPHGDRLVFDSCWAADTPRQAGS